MILVKRFTYRGFANEEWSNRYYLTGEDPADNAAWLQLFTALAGGEATLYPSNHKITRAYGYTSDSPNASAVYVRDLLAQGSEIPGTLAQGSGFPTSGDVAGWIRWKTARTTSAGKAIYLRKYYHGVPAHPTDPDKVLPEALAIWNAFATNIGGGAGLDGRNIRGPGQASDTILASNAGIFLTTRTLKRRGKRPTPAP